jgi:hypothetical protein
VVRQPSLSSGGPRPGPARMHAGVGLEREPSAPRLHAESRRGAVEGFGFAKPRGTVEMPAACHGLAGAARPACLTPPEREGKAANRVL